MRVVAYLNAYAVERHYGGPEEGGWYYNAGEPLASVPVHAEVTLHDVDADSDEPTCRGCVEGRNPKCPDNEVTFDAAESAAARSLLHEMFSHVVEGNIYSSRGGVALEIRRELEMAKRWPAGRPHYE